MKASDLPPKNRAVELMGVRLERDPKSKGTETPETNRDLMEHVPERSALLDDRVDYWWGQSMEQLSAVDPESIAGIAVRTISGGDVSKRDKASGILARLATVVPGVVMERVGAALLDPKPGWHGMIWSDREIFGTLPAGTVMQWLSTAKVEGARKVPDTCLRHSLHPMVRPWSQS